MVKSLRSVLVRVSGLVVALGIGATCGWPVLAQTTSGQLRGALPPIIDRDLFFGDPEIAGAQISPDGQFIAFLKPLNGTRNIWVKRADEPFDKARPITADTKRPISASAYFWSRDAKYILYAQDAAGDENFNVYAVRPMDSPAPGTEVPASRNLTAAKGVRAQIYLLPKSDPDAIFVGLNDRDKAWHDLYKVRISSGERTLLRTNTERVVSWGFDLADRLRLATRVNDAGDTEVMRVDDSGFTKIYTCNVFESCGPAHFAKDGRRVYMQTNKGTDLVRLTLLDTETMKEEPVESDPENRVDLGDAMFSESTDELVATTYVDDKPRYVWHDKAFEADYNLLRQKLPGKQIQFANSTKDDRLFIVGARSDVDPGTTYLYDRQAKALTTQYQIREKLPRAALSPMTPVRYPSSDGLMIPAYLTLPKGYPTTGLPLVVLPHGGPWARDVWGYNGLAQFLANRGYAVLEPNFRGSTGYGKKFLDAGNKQWGDKMQDDLTWGVKYLVRQGTVDPKRVGILGGSYGGYATLAGVAFTPDVYSAAVSIVGPSNLITLLGSIPPYWEAARKVFSERMGDPTTPEGKAQLERQSPLNAASKIKTPLMVIQGANDPRVNRAESEQIVIALRDRGFPVEYILAPDEGHGFARPINNIATYAAAEKFLAGHLKGRYQEYLGPDVSARLKVLTVDPKTVTLTKKVDPAAVGVPTPATELRTGTSNYAVSLDMGGQKMALTATSEIKKQDDGTWLAVETMNTPMGAAVDRAVLEKDTLVLRKRTITQGPVSVDLESRDGKITGEMKMNGQGKPIAVDSGGELFADGAGSNDVIATLPLADGYSTTFRNFDAQAQQVRSVQLKVLGSESVTVAAGTFDAFKVEVVTTGGPTATEWIAKNPRRVVKVVAVLPQMNGATITLELQK
ncbi:MAG TPA: alpha/beta fold hydrolase [Vicinamibacterales bacterium]|nr:alpha/beta fold hydrolase [Vicinamibacterales bacterium]